MHRCGPMKEQLVMAAKKSKNKTNRKNKHMSLHVLALNGQDVHASNLVLVDCGIRVNLFTV